MLLYVSAQHTADNCPVTRLNRGENIPPQVEVDKWIEGTDKVKVHGAWGFQTGHRVFAIIEANDYQYDLLEGTDHTGKYGTIEIKPVGDMVAIRKEAGRLSVLPQFDY